MSRKGEAQADEDEVAHPRAATALFGHAAAESTLLDAYKSGRIPHAWLIGGPRGIGKATLAFRMARFVFAHPDFRAPSVQEADSLAVEADQPAFGLVQAQSHPDLLVLERTIGDNGKLRTVIRVDEARRVSSFLGSTAALGGWRVVIVDAVDDLNAESANALLKGLEEPPARTLFLLVSHAPGMVLPTIRSRCQRLMLRPLDRDDLARALEAATGESVDASVLDAAEGSVSRALALMEGPAFKLRKQAIALLKELPAENARDLHSLGDALSMADQKDAAVVMDAVNDWLSARLRQVAADKSKAARVAQVFSELNEAASTAEEYNLDRKPLIFKTFGLLAEVARG